MIHRAALRALEAAPQIADWVTPWMAGWTALFIAGAMTRFSFAMMTAGAVVWSVVYTMRVGAHSVEVLIVAMVCLLAARWGDRWSVDAWLARRAIDWARWRLGDEGRVTLAGPIAIQR